MIVARRGAVGDWSRKPSAPSAASTWKRRRFGPRRAAWPALLACFGLLHVSQATGAEERAFQTARLMGRGVNVLGYDGIWEGGTDAPFRLSYFEMIRRAGFGHVRINLFGFKYMNATNQLDTTVLERLDLVVDQAIRAGLIPVIDEHDYGSCQADPSGCATKLKSFWNQISARYAGRCPTAVFEILNEPGGALSQQVWNKLASEVLQEIRATNPRRTVIVAAINSDDPHQLSLLELPKEDRNIIVTVHYYKPITFTHQGAEWSPTFSKLHDIPWGSAEDRKTVNDDFGVVDAWAKAEHRPVYLGEFSVYEHAPLEARLRYISFVARAAEHLGWAWAYWQFDHDFALFDTTKQQWVAPVLKALIPKPSTRSNSQVR